MPKRAAQRIDHTEPASLPEVLIPPGDAKDEQKAAYWIELLDNPEALRKATGTTEFFQLLNEFPASLWGDRLSISVMETPAAPTTQPGGGASAAASVGPQAGDSKS